MCCIYVCTLRLWVIECVYVLHTRKLVVISDGTSDVGAASVITILIYRSYLTSVSYCDLLIILYLVRVFISTKSEEC